MYCLLLKILLLAGIAVMASANSLVTCQLPRRNCLPTNCNHSVLSSLDDSLKSDEFHLVASNFNIARQNARFSSFQVCESHCDDFCNSVPDTTEYICVAYEIDDPNAACLVNDRHSKIGQGRSLLAFTNKDADCCNGDSTTIGCITGQADCAVISKEIIRQVGGGHDTGVGAISQEEAMHRDLMRGVYVELKKANAEKEEKIAGFTYSWKDGIDLYSYLINVTGAFRTRALNHHTYSWNAEVVPFLDKNFTHLTTIPILKFKKNPRSPKWMLPNVEVHLDRMKVTSLIGGEPFDVAVKGLNPLLVGTSWRVDADAPLKATALGQDQEFVCY